MDEDNILLTVPEDVAEVLRRAAEGEVSVEFDDGARAVPRSHRPSSHGYGRARAEFDVKRSATLRVGEHTLPARLMGLPTVVETHKSVDGATYFKSGIVSEVLVAEHDGAALPAGSELADGLTAPTAGIRKRKWGARSARDKEKVMQVALDLEAHVAARKHKVIPAERELVEIDQYEEVRASDDEGADAGDGGAGGGRAQAGGASSSEAGGVASARPSDESGAEEVAAPTLPPPAPPPAAPPAVQPAAAAAAGSGASAELQAALQDSVRRLQSLRAEAASLADSAHHANPVIKARRQARRDEKAAQIRDAEAAVEAHRRELVAREAVRGPAAP